MVLCAAVMNTGPLSSYTRYAMDVTKLIKFGLVFIAVFGVVAFNLSDGMVRALGFMPNYSIAAVIALLVAVMTVERELALVALVLVLCVLANLPSATVAAYGIPRELLLGTLVVVVLTPLVARLLRGS